MPRKVAEYCLDAHNSYHVSAISPGRLQGLGDLTEAIETRLKTNSQMTAMLRALVGHICICLNKAPKTIAIIELTDLRLRLKAYLRERDFRQNSVRSYINYLRILLDLANKLGWSAHLPEIEKAWAPILACVSKPRRGATMVVHFAIRANKAPQDFTDADMENFALEQAGYGRRFEYTQNAKAAFRTRILKAGLAGMLPKLSFRRADRRGMRPPQLPEAVDSQLSAVLDWKTADFLVGRPSRTKQRPATAMRARLIVRRLFAFVTTVLGRQIDTLSELLSQDNVSRYVEWCLNVFKLSTPSLQLFISTIAALGQHPSLGGRTFAWAKGLMADLPADIEGRVQQLKARKWVDYDELAKTPDRALQDARRSSGLKLKALLVRDALMLRWLLVLPWRQKNLRQCRIGTLATSNLVKEEISPLAMISKPKWVEEALKSNPHQKFWQFRFSPDETKNGHQVQGLVPKQLIEPLEDYLTNYRSLLVNGHDPGTLFLNEHRCAYSTGAFTTRIGHLTARYAGRRVTPHLFRDIFAVKYLQERPEDYLTLSKILWHRNLKTTLNNYGARFDESHGARRVEEWLEEHKKRR
jgi:integrase